MWNQVYNPFGNATVSTHRRRHSRRHAAGADRDQQGQGAHRRDHRAGRWPISSRSSSSRCRPTCRSAPRCSASSPASSRSAGSSSTSSSCTGSRSRPAASRLLQRAIGGVTNDRRLQTPADRVFVRRVLRGRVGLRHAGRRHRRGPDRARLLAARRLRPVADRQHRAGRLWRARHADPGPRHRHRLRSVHSRRDGRPAVAVLLADRAVLGGLGVRRLEGHEGSLARDPRHRRCPSRSRNS